MAAEELVAYTEDRDDSAVIPLGQGEVHTLIPRFNGRAGKVVVQTSTSDADVFSTVATLSSRPSSNKMWQIVGPIDYRVSVRNAGCDYNVG